MGDEFKNDIPEFNPTVENKTFKENIVYQENIDAPEVKVAPEFTDPTEKKPRQFNRSKKDNTLSLFTGGLVTAVAAAVVGITGMLNVAMSAEFDNVSYTDGVISYSINVKDMSEKETLTTYFYENTTLLDSISMVDEDGDGVISGEITIDTDHLAELLAQGNNVSVKYRLDLKGVVGLDLERAFDSYVVQIDKMTSEFGSVESWCNCKVDGYFYFQMNFSDDYNLFTDFEASITDAFGNISYCTFTEDLHAPQRIPVLSLRGSSGTLKISYSSDGTPAEVTQQIKF